jgi:Domain of unknown function DUF1828
MMRRKADMNCEELKSQVNRWFDQELECRAEGTALTLALPLLKPDGDALEIGIEPSGDDQWILSDLGDIHAHFYLAGIDLFEDSSRADEYRQIVNESRITERENELLLETSSSQLAPLIFEFAHALQSIFALQFTTKLQSLSRDFPSIVAKFLAEQHTSFEIPSDKIPGKTGEWKFNFILNHSNPRTLVRALSIPKATEALRTAKQTVFEINDIRGLALQNEDIVVIADDEGERANFWRPHIIRLFDGYQIPIIPFEAKREELLDLARTHAS